MGRVCAMLTRYKIALNKIFEFWIYTIQWCVTYLYIYTSSLYIVPINDKNISISLVNWIHVWQHERHWECI